MISCSQSSEEIDRPMRLESIEWPRVHDTHPIAILDGIDKAQLHEWLDHDSKKLFAIPFECEARTQEGQNSVKSKLLKAVFGLTRSLNTMVAAPKPDGESNQDPNLPLTFLIYGLEEHSYNKLLSNTIWSSEAITFRVVSLDFPRPDFLFTIKGFSTLDVGAIYKMVHKVWHDEQTGRYFQELIDGAPDVEKAHTKQVLQNFVESMRTERLNIKVSGGLLSPKFNVLADCSTIPSDDLWSRLSDYFAARTYNLPLQGDGTVQTRPYRCGLCHGVDHPSGLCPFPNVKGWKGPRQLPMRRQGGGRPPTRSFRPY
jgi:hypothetical protein